MVPKGFGLTVEGLGFGAWGWGLGVKVELFAGICELNLPGCRYLWDVGLLNGLVQLCLSESSPRFET